MSDDERPRPPAAAAERTMLAGRLDRHRATLEMKCAWFRRRLAGEDAPPLYYSDDDPDGDFDDIDPSTTDDAFAAWRAACARAREIAAALPSLDVMVTDRAGRRLSARWCSCTWSRSTPATTATPTCCGSGSTARSVNEAGLPPVDADLELALRLADTADAITLARFRAADLRVTRKPDRTPVTDADTAVEDALRATIAAERPGDAVLGEERGGAVADAERGWVLDPIDGTKNYSRGVPVWATLIALAVRGEPVVGVASAPALGRRWWAARGEGAWASDPSGTRRITVSGVTELADAYLSTTDVKAFAEIGRRDDYLRLVDACWETRAFGDFWMYCLVAEGVLDVAVDAVASPWDLAALVPIVTEAGGALTDLGGAGTFAGGDGLASNGAVHKAVLEIVGR